MQPAPPPKKRVCIIGGGVAGERRQLRRLRRTRSGPTRSWHCAVFFFKIMQLTPIV